MLLKYLELQGFKSFPDKTRVNFGRGMTAVVGPNGSGKSNISDAVRWVLGEQSTKTLRGDKMEDVIFAGTKTRKKQSFAEVSLALDNTDRELQIDQDEVTITRRYNRAGESEYMINRSPVRLKDITELLMDTGLGRDGYSLIGQGKIAEIISAKSTDRREIFEEASGIAKYRYRKNESERSLARAEDNLVRLRDILSELEDRVGPLKEQSQKAKEYLNLAGEKKSIEISLWIDTIEKSNLSLKDQSDRLLVCQEKYDGMEEQIQNIDEEMQNTYRAMQECLVQNESAHQEKSDCEKQISEANAQIAVCENEVSHRRQTIQRIDDEISGRQKDADQIKTDVENKRTEITGLESLIQELDREIAIAQESLLLHLNENESLGKQEREFSEELNQAILLQSQANMTIVTANENLNEIALLLSEYQSRRNQKAVEMQGYCTERDETAQLLKLLSDKSEELINSKNGYAIKLENRRQKLEQYKTELGRIDLSLKEHMQKIQLLEGMEQSMEGFVYSVREIIKRSQRGSLSGILGTVSQLINVPDEYSVAVETAISASLQSIIVENEANAKAAIKLLKSENMGRATFLPLTSVNGSLLRVDGLEQFSGYIDLAVNLVAFSEKYRPAMNALLGRIVIVDDIDTAVQIAQKFGYKFKIVTLDGQVVNAGGSLTGGSKNKSQGILSRKNDIQLLQKKSNELAERFQKGQEAVNTLQREVSQIEADHTAVLAELTTANEDRIRVEGEEKRLEQVIAQCEETLSSMEKELLQSREKQQHYQEIAEKNQVELVRLSTQIGGLNEKLISLHSIGQDASDKQERLTGELNEKKLQQLSLQKDIESKNQEINSLILRQKDADNTAEQLSQEKEACEAAILQIQQDIEEKYKKITAFREQTVQLNQRSQELLEKRQQLEGQTTALRKSISAIQSEKEKFSAEMVRIDEKKMQIQAEYDQLIQKLWDEYELTRSEAQKLAHPLESVSKAKSELNTLRNKIRALGSVNVDSIEEYKQVSERYEFLSAQIADAERSKAELVKLISDLTDKMETIFAENFGKINRYFQTIFAELFGGGRAELLLSDPSALLESGVEIMVEPPGKVINNLASLSGGEQALVAISIYFAILKVHPAPFCILDEIEAALDDINVDKYAAYLHNMCGQTQFIAITHRRGTMETADVLYGVTMQDKGVSKLLELKVSEIEEKLHMDSSKGT